MRTTSIRARTTDTSGLPSVASQPVLHASDHRRNRRGFRSPSARRSPPHRHVSGVRGDERRAEGERNPRRFRRWSEACKTGREATEGRPLVSVVSTLRDVVRIQERPLRPRLLDLPSGEGVSTHYNSDLELEVSLTCHGRKMAPSPCKKNSRYTVFLD